MPYNSHDVSSCSSIRYGYRIYHNKDHSLILRGDNFENEVQKVLSILVLLSNKIFKKTVFADVGANIGLHTFFLKSFNKDLEVIAFDPSPAANYMEMTIKTNNISNVRLEKIALNDRTGMVDFFNWCEESTAESLRDTKRVAGVPNVIKVPAMKLDDIGNLPPITVMKIDCEGGELSILKGAATTIAKNKPLIVSEFYKIHSDAFGITSAEIFEYVESLGYSMFSLDFVRLTKAAFQTSQDNLGENYILLPNALMPEISAASQVCIDKRFHPFDAIPVKIQAKWIMDVGANVGDVTVAALESYPECNVICFEPVKETFNKLQQNVMRYGTRTHLYNFALANEDGGAEINLTTFHGANSIMPQAPFHKHFNPHVQESGKEIITLKRLDDIADKLPARHIDIMKIDVEGYEVEVIKGAEQFICNCVDTIIIEISLMRDPSWRQQAIVQIISLLDKFGFALINIFDLHNAPATEEMMLVQMDCAFRKKNLLEDPDVQ